MDLGSWESLNDVGLLFLLHLLNLVFYQLNHNVVLDVAVGLNRLLDLFAESRALADFLINEVTRADACEVVVLAKVLREGEGYFFAFTAWRPHEHNAHHY